MKTYFTCPVCGKPLEQTEKSFVCADRHTFDTAAEGYVNLSPPRKDADRSGDAATRAKRAAVFWKPVPMNRLQTPCARH